MAKITKEDKIELKMLVNELKVLTLSLRNLYRYIMGTLFRLYIYTIGWIALIVLSYFFVSKVSKFYIILMSILFVLNFIALLIYRRYKLRQYVKRYNKLYMLGKEQLYKLINYVDWGAFRKRQLYEDNDNQVENVVGDFLIETRKICVPVRSNTIFELVSIIQILLQYGALALSCFVVYVKLMMCNMG